MAKSAGANFHRQEAKGAKKINYSKKTWRSLRLGGSFLPLVELTTPFPNWLLNSV
jgi:hypothetical protein